MLLKTASFLGFLFLLYLMWAADSGNLPSVAIAFYDFPYGDKIGHFGLYGLIACFLSLAFPQTRQVGKLHISIIMVIFLVFAIGEEWSQSLFPRRTADPIDGLCSCLGILAGTWVAYRVRKPKKCQ
jgi:VanZ family protein